MRLGLISDVHGNATALEAVLEDGHARGVESWWVLGDMVAIGPEPVRTLEVLTGLTQVKFTAGKTERYVVTNDRPPPYPDEVRADPDLLEVFAAVQRSFAWTCGALAAEGWLKWLAALALEIRTVLPDGTILLGLHATPGRDDGEGITPHRDKAELQQALAGANADIVCAGHTHQPTDRQLGAVRAVNLGSVSNPVTDDLRASYVIVHADRHGHALQHRRVSYDRDRFLAALARSGHPEADYIASFQQGKQVRFASRREGAPAVTE